MLLILGDEGLNVGRRSKSEDGTLRSRSARTVFTTLRNLSGLWTRMRKLRLLAANVWSEVERPRIPMRLPRVPPEAAFTKLLEWLDTRFPGPDGAGWPLMRTYLHVKMLAGCRLDDLCQALTAQFDQNGGTLRIAAEHDKTHRERLITLPRRLVEELERLKGLVYLWEHYCRNTPTYRPGGNPAKTFRPSLMYHAVKSIFREYGRTHPDHKVKTHDLRKRAITLTGIALKGDLDAVSRAIPVTPETARRHYLDAQMAHDAAAIQKRMAEVLLPRAAAQAEPARRI